MTVTLIFLLVLLVLALLILPFTRDMVKDKMELEKQPLDKKFEILVEYLNQGLLFGDGKVARFDDSPRFFNLFAKEHANRILHFAYSTGHLTIEMGYKYFQHELRFKKQYYNLRDVSVFEQKNIARDFIELATIKIKQHEALVNKNSASCISENPTKLPKIDENNPLQLLDDFYDCLTPEQRMAMINHMVIIDASTSGDYHLSYNNSLILQCMTLMNVGAAQCRKMLEENGEETVYNELKALRNQDLHLDLHISECAILVKEFARNIEELETRAEKMSETCSRIGLTDEDITECVQKIVALNEFFNRK